MPRLCCIVALLAAASAATVTPAAPIVPGTPVYSVTFLDAVTGDAAPTRATNAYPSNDPVFNAFGNGGRFGASGQISYDIDQFQPGSTTQRADDYLNEVYERPTDQTFVNHKDVGNNTRFGLSPTGIKYYSYIDIVSVQVGFDANFLYVSIDLYGLNAYYTGNGQSHGENALNGYYAFRIGEYPIDPESRSGYFVRFQQPTVKDAPGAAFALNPTADVFRDVNANVGGRSIDGSVDSTREGGDITGDGYEVQVVADGYTKSGPKTPALYTRVDPTDPTKVEFAFRYGLFGFTASDLISPDLFLLFQATDANLDGGADPFFNDKYNFEQAGTPNPDLRGYFDPSPDSNDLRSRYLRTGLGNIYRLDTLRGGGLGAPVPEPGSLLVFGGMALAFAAGAVRRRGIRRSASEGR